MKIVCFDIVILCMFLTTKENRGQRLVTERKLAAVTSPSHLEEIYVRIKDEFSVTSTHLNDEDSGSQRREDYEGALRIVSSYPLGFSNSRARFLSGNEKKRDLQDKSAICAGIFNSSFFRWFEEEAVDFSLQEEKTIEQLKEKNPKIYVDIYKNWPFHMGPNEWLNPIRRRDISVGEKKFSEKVFKCLTRKKHSEEDLLREYFVSPFYQSDSDNCRMDGRFIFSVDKNGELKLFAMAEETGKVNEDILEIHRQLYEGRHSGYSFNHVPVLNICEFSTPNKIRLCSMVLNAAGYPDRIKFIPSPENIEPECKQRKVVARVKTEKNQSDVFPRTHEVYENEYEIISNEKMIGCKGTYDDAKVPPFFLRNMYCISRGIFPESAVVFKPLVGSDLYYPYVGVTDIYI